MNIKISAITDVGKERMNNEDAITICSDIEKQNWDLNNSTNYQTLGKYGCLMVVADGMGGSNNGEIASSIAIDTIKKCFTEEIVCKLDLTEVNIYKHIYTVFQQANNAILEHVTNDPNSIGLGTTIVLTWIIHNYAYIAWCGDSRCYCYNQDFGLKQLTKDHSYVQELVDKGEIAASQVYNHPDSNIITRCLGDVDVYTEPDIITYKIQDGDILLSCSDGLSGYCNDKSIEKVMFNYYDQVDLCKDHLLHLALNIGGQDNITIALCATLSDSKILPVVTLSTKIKRFLTHWLKNSA